MSKIGAPISLHFVRFGELGNYAYLCSAEMPKWSSAAFFDIEDLSKNVRALQRLRLFRTFVKANRLPSLLPATILSVPRCT